jgi:FAD-dependent urate hydroxylase
MSSHQSSTEVAIVGAGPYGLSIASYLSHLDVEHRIFGWPMRTWWHMFPTMGLKSPDFGTNIYTPRPGFSFIEYSRSRERDLTEPIPIALFAEYGTWAQERLVPEVEQCSVTAIRGRQGGFEVQLDTGERVAATQVVMAVGLTYWRRMPKVFAGLPLDLVSHTSQHQDLSTFGGSDVTVIGAGQSALEAATLLAEHGAATRLLVRGGGAYFAGAPAGRRSLKDRVLYPRSVLGPGRLNFFLERAPTAPHHLMSHNRRVRLTRTHLGPWGAWWLRDRFERSVPVHPRCVVVGASPAGSRLRLRVRRDDGSDWEFTTDHVVCGTGYEVDLGRTPILDPELVARLRRLERGPMLSRHFESSVPGLYFVGAASAFSFGPLFRFVAGAAYTAPKVARRIKRVARARVRAGDPKAPARGRPNWQPLGGDSPSGQS